MKLAFVLSMPGVASWNGRWSGEGKLYAVVRNFGSSQKTRAWLGKVVADGPYRYHWSDGWAAKVDVREVEPSEGRKLAKASSGFCGYEWMIDSILQYGHIYADHEKPEKVSSSQ